MGEIDTISSYPTVEKNSNGKVLYYGSKPYKDFKTELEKEYKSSFGDPTPYFMQSMPLSLREYRRQTNQLYVNMTDRVFERYIRQQALPGQNNGLDLANALEKGDALQMRYAINDDKPELVTPTGIEPNYKYKTDEEFFEANPQAAMLNEHYKYIGTYTDKDGNLVQPEEIGIFFPRKRYGSIPFLHGTKITDWMAKDNDRNYNDWANNFVSMYGDEQLRTVDDIKLLNGIRVEELPNNEGTMVYFKKYTDDNKPSELGLHVLSAFPQESFLYTQFNANKSVIDGYDINGNRITNWYSGLNSNESMDRLAALTLTTVGGGKVAKLLGKGLSKLPIIRQIPKLVKGVGSSISKGIDKAGSSKYKAINKPATRIHNLSSKMPKGNKAEEYRKYLFRGLDDRSADNWFVRNLFPNFWHEASVSNLLYDMLGFSVGAAGYQQLRDRQEGDITPLSQQAGLNDFSNRFGDLIMMPSQSVNNRRALQIGEIIREANQTKKDLYENNQTYGDGLLLQYYDDVFLQLDNNLEAYRNSPNATQKEYDYQKTKAENKKKEIIENVINEAFAVGYNPDKRPIYITEYNDKTGLSSGIRQIKDQKEFEKLKTAYEACEDKSMLGTYMNGRILGPQIKFVDEDGKTRTIVIDKDYTQSLKNGMFSKPSFMSKYMTLMSNSYSGSITLPSGKGKLINGHILEKKDGTKVNLKRNEVDNLFLKECLMREGKENIIKNISVNGTLDYKNAEDLIRNYVFEQYFQNFGGNVAEMLQFKEAVLQGLEDYDPNTISEDQLKYLTDIDEIRTYLLSELKKSKIGLEMNKQQ